MSPERSYKIVELTRMFGLTARTLRYYEELGLLESEDRDATEHRRYSERNVVRLKRVQQLKDYGLTLSEIRELFDLAKRDRTGVSVRESLAAKYRARLEDAKRRRESLDAYIEDLSWHVEQLERVSDFFDCPGASCAACRWAERCDVRALIAKDA
ncbi:MAG TPA: MerR family transcriptional regulator [Spirochaetales bacterium]|nr:MerR family transcriptional regulator [Spirochaetales bacterium]HPB65195.1 MerR family transcriptional regulator [Spirochaetales bacterium]HPG86238.1 MerR family transcriptional regulator [Spirochaetales bacterium]HPM71353.1 MerR family transcriptional regulator [Spirochaetales bacterium]